MKGFRCTSRILADPSRRAAPRLPRLGGADEYPISLDLISYLLHTLIQSPSIAHSFIASCIDMH